MDRLSEVEIQACVFYLGLAIELIGPYGQIAEEDGVGERRRYFLVVALGLLKEVNVVSVDEELLVQLAVLV